MRKVGCCRVRFLSLGCLILPLFLLSCSTHMSTRASAVRLVSPEQAHEIEGQCDFLANVSGEGHWMLLTDVAHNNALNEILDHAAELGATHLFINKGNFRKLFGEAYFCVYCQDEKGEPDTARCEDKKGNAVSAKDMEECRANGNVWVGIARDRARCEEKGGKWVTNRDVLRGTSQRSTGKK